VRIATYARGKVITVRLSQSVHSGIAVFFSRLPIIVTVPIVKTGLFCHRSVPFSFSARTGHRKTPTTVAIRKSQARLTGNGDDALLN
jgi:hypothetical protein